MLFSSEAPRRPFSAVRSRQTGELLTTTSSSGEEAPVIIDPRILFVVSQPSDIAYFVPSLWSLLGTERRENCEVFALSLSTGYDDDAGSGREEWNDVLNRFGVEKANRALLDS